MKIRIATVDDVENMSQILEELVAANKRTSASDTRFVQLNYVSNPNGIRCSVAEDQDGIILGFQSLIHATEGNHFGVEVGWGIIGTHVSPRAFRRGIGSNLWRASVQAAILEGLTKIDARIDDTNIEALAYYRSIGFKAYKTSTGVTSHCYTITPAGMG